MWVWSHLLVGEMDKQVPFFRRLILMHAIFVCLGNAGPLPGKKILRIRLEAEELYQQKKYPEACLRYQQIADNDSNDANVRTELGLCLQKIHRNDSALIVSREALRLGSKSLTTNTLSGWSNPDLRTRKSAYFNLDKMGDPMHEPDSGKCEIWATFNSCNQSLFVCTEIGRKNTLEGKVRWSVSRVGLTPQKARFTEAELETFADLPQPEIRDMEAVGIEGHFEAKKRWLNRDSSITLPLGQVLENKPDGYSIGKNQKEQTLSECRVLYFDPCAGIVGMACALVEEGDEDQVVVSEYYLIPAH